MAKKIEKIKEKSKLSKFSGASPIISTRPLNKVAEKASQHNTPLGTPSMKELKRKIPKRIPSSDVYFKDEDLPYQ